MKISKKIILIVFSFIIIISAFNCNLVYADPPDLADRDWVVTDEFSADDWRPTSSSEGDSKLVEIGQNIIGPVQVIGSLVSVIAIIIMGIRYMLGSIEEKAQYKETLWPYFLGAVLVFGITNVLSIVYNIAKSI